ncbi:hypothetical protein VHEMI02554 [[Torrubiella] hemipterigena]|uniref:Uncharacterized protein n=1 Tax=[Torrubiella] hemipterigena TaxID=1531966 RepID=A0A0A1TAU6_9HYPO|nr:hypothetical protein VHEMI02554 [[Torrubiella] hemipterigena]
MASPLKDIAYYEHCVPPISPLIYTPVIYSIGVLDWHVNQLLQKKFCPAWCKLTEEGCVDSKAKFCDVTINPPPLCYVSSGPCGFGPDGCLDDEEGDWDGLSVGAHKGHWPSVYKACATCQQSKAHLCADATDFETKSICEEYVCSVACTNNSAAQCNQCPGTQAGGVCLPVVHAFQSPECQEVCGISCFTPERDCENCREFSKELCKATPRSNCEELLCGPSCCERDQTCLHCRTLQTRRCTYFKDSRRRELCEATGVCANYCATPQDLCDICSFYQKDACEDRLPPVKDMPKCIKDEITKQCSKQCIEAYGKD